MAEVGAFPAPAAGGAAHIPLPTLLSQSLLAFANEFDRDSPAPLALSANVLRVLGEKPVRVADLPRLTGGSPEQSALGWRLKRYVVVEPDPSARRGKVVRLTLPGLKARQRYRQLAGKIEKRWEAQVGKGEIRSLRESLEGLFTKCRGNRLLLPEGLAPPAGVARAGDQVPALGRRDVGAAARERMRGLVAQTEVFVRDPANTLPHYPLWDMNRGFGP